MRSLSSFIAAILLIVCLRWTPGMMTGQSPVRRSDALRDDAIDPASPLESRVKRAPAAVLKMFSDLGHAGATAHDLTAVERRRLSTAFAALLPCIAASSSSGCEA
jgi:hypothetical protein